MTPVPRTEESFLGPLVNPADEMARRVADLTAQVDFLDLELARQHELLETERIRHAKAKAELMLAADARADEMRRVERHQTEALHASYRRLLGQRQAACDATISKMTDQHETALAQERDRHEQIVAHERSRRETELAGAKKRAHDELAAEHSRSRHSLVVQADAAKAAARRQQAQNAELHQELDAARARLEDMSANVAELEERLQSVIDRHGAEIDDLNARLATAEARATADRQRSAATLAEVLSRSASVATAADEQRAHHAAQLARLESLLAATQEQAQKELDALTEAADVRSQLAAEREADLEAQIERLRSDRRE